MKVKELYIGQRVKVGRWFGNIMALGKSNGTIYDVFIRTPKNKIIKTTPNKIKVWSANKKGQ